MATRRGPDNSVRVAIAQTVATKPAVNVFHAQLTTSSSIIQADLDTWLTAFAAAFKTAFVAHQSTQVAYVTATGTLYTPGGGVLQSSSAMTGNGTNGGTGTQDASACKNVSWQTTVYWRGGKPRTYLGGVTTTDLAASSWTSLSASEITSLTTQGNSFRTAVNALTAGTITGTTFGFVSFSSGNVARGTPLFFPITGSKVHPKMGTQRRRLGKWSV